MKEFLTGKEKIVGIKAVEAKDAEVKEKSIEVTSGYRFAGWFKLDEDYEKEQPLFIKRDFDKLPEEDEHKLNCDYVAYHSHRWFFLFCTKLHISSNSDSST